LAAAERLASVFSFFVAKAKCAFAFTNWNCAFSASGAVAEAASAPCKIFQLL
jgi:hypothetical protein